MTVMAAPMATASPEFFLEEVREKVQTPITDGQALRLGDVACRALRAGVEKGLTFGQARNEADNAVGSASQQLGLGLTLADGMFLVEAAEHQLC
ncbi:hypothetical protein [Mycolicibacterium duvalii]|uniref:hypothetical protein n=1 Tax=Mycolicibacterium duvalii TaxID=39688 RepID=UPI00105524D5|nr:hypothetical protein [Mycolicibacterium duvalii]MCV7366655.1 hypothetical protein [Mycolicibacterium duvalii]